MSVDELCKLIFVFLAQLVFEFEDNLNQEKEFRREGVLQRRKGELLWECHSEINFSSL